MSNLMMKLMFQAMHDHKSVVHADKCYDGGVTQGGKPCIGSNLCPSLLPGSKCFAGGACFIVPLVITACHCVVASYHLSLQCFVNALSRVHPAYLLALRQLFSGHSKMTELVAVWQRQTQLRADWELL